MDSKKTNRTRRQRGYAFETSIVKTINDLPGWRAKRLGSPSTELPDVFAFNNSHSIAIAIEAKSGTTNNLYIPQDQVQRCQDWVDDLGVYKTRDVVLAFKFSQKKNMGNSIYKMRQLRYYYKIWPKGKPAQAVSCNYDGKTTVKVGEKWDRGIDLEDYDFK